MFGKWLDSAILAIHVRRRINLAGPIRWGGNAKECREREGFLFGDYIVDWETVCAKSEKRVAEFEKQGGK